MILGQLGCPSRYVNDPAAFNLRIADCAAAVAPT